MDPFLLWEVLFFSPLSRDFVSFTWKQPSQIILQMGKVKYWNILLSTKANFGALKLYLSSSTLHKDVLRLTRCWQQILMVTVKFPPAEQGSSCSETELQPQKMHLEKEQIFPPRHILIETSLWPTMGWRQVLDTDPGYSQKNWMKTSSIPEEKFNFFLSDSKIRAVRNLTWKTENVK